VQTTNNSIEIIYKYHANRTIITSVFASESIAISQQQQKKEKSLEKISFYRSIKKKLKKHSTPESYYKAS
jgi:hypothetical protein